MRWSEFEKARPDLAAEGRRLLYQFGVGLAFLGTVAKDGSPRVHPMCPILKDDGLYALIEPGPKLGDLRRDGRYALHCFPPAGNEDAFYVTGRATELHDDALLAELKHQFFVVERSQPEVPPQAGSTTPFELTIERCLVTATDGHGDWAPRHTVWRS